MFRFLYSSETASPFSQDDLIGRDAYVLVGIPRTAWGTISLEVEGLTQQYRATSSEDIERGAMVRITGVAGNGLIVQPRAAEAEPAGGDDESPATSG
jgi:membrane protein implicated in regulation of membrane protease activity